MADQCIVDVCRTAWDGSFTDHVLNKNNCSGFVKAVAAALNIPMPNAQADGIADHLSRNWTQLNSGAEAALKAGQGYLVIACLKGSEHNPVRANGHVAIVVTGGLYRGKYPRCWGGSLGSAQSNGSLSTGEVWNSRDRDNVRYYAYSIAVCSAG